MKKWRFFLSSGLWCPLPAVLWRWRLTPKFGTKCWPGWGLPTRGFVDRLGLREEALSSVRRLPAHCCCFHSSRKNRRRTEGVASHPQVYFMKQATGNPCGVIGLTHAVVNIKTKWNLRMSQSWNCFFVKWRSCVLKTERNALKRMRPLWQPMVLRHRKVTIGYMTKWTFTLFCLTTWMATSVNELEKCLSQWTTAPVQRPGGCRSVNKRKSAFLPLVSARPPNALSQCTKCFHPLLKMLQYLSEMAVLIWFCSYTHPQPHPNTSQAQLWLSSLV